ncbi:MAG: glycosyltransferase [Thermoleophilia bacterium]|nr:glycosyltransferase [Thermoleophilia bacterium]
MIPAYNAARYLPEALESVLGQDPGQREMQIEVVDDASAEDPTALVRQVAGDRVVVHRHAENRGHVATFNTCIERARGEFVHLLHADDAVRPGFYARLGAALVAQPAAGAAFCRYISIDEHGQWRRIAPLEQPEAGFLEGWLEKLATGQRLQPPCIVVRRSVYEQIGAFDPRIRSYGEDWEMWTRIAARFPVWYEPEPLALYRVAGGSLSRSALRTGDNVIQLLQVIEMIRTVLPPERAAELTTTARRVTAHTAIRRGVRLARAGDRAAALAQLRASVRADHSPRTLLYLLLGIPRVLAPRRAR